MNTSLGLHQLAPGECGIVKHLHTLGSMRRRFSDIGLTENALVECVGRSPFGDPSAYRIRGAVIAIRASDGCSVEIVRCRQGG